MEAARFTPGQSSTGQATGQALLLVQVAVSMADAQSTRPILPPLAVARRYGEAGRLARRSDFGC